MESSLREIEQREKMKKEKRHIETMIKYERAKICPKCGEKRYIQRSSERKEGLIWNHH